MQWIFVYDVLVVIGFSKACEELFSSNDLWEMWKEDKSPFCRQASFFQFQQWYYEYIAAQI